MIQHIAWLDYCMTVTYKYKVIGVIGYSEKYVTFPRPKIEKMVYQKGD